MKRLVILSAVLIGLTAATLVLLLGGSSSDSASEEPGVEASSTGRAELVAPPLARLRALSEATRVAHGRLDGAGTTDTGSARAPTTVQASATAQAPAPEAPPRTAQARTPLSARERAARLSDLERSIQLTRDPGKREGLILSYLEQASALDSHGASSEWMKRLDRLIGSGRATR